MKESGLTMCTMKAALAAGTTTTFSTTGTTLYCIDGEAYSVAAASNVATPTTDVVTGVAFVAVAANYGCVFVFGYNAAGAIKVAQGAITDLDSAGNFILSPEYPPIPADFCPFGELIIQAGSTTVAPGWVFGTSNQASVTGVTYTRNDLMTLKSRPHSS